ncbi:MAG: DUF411 domain-containing protein [Acidobacteriota bacterium]|nr:DUF411 domain-containing protein [Acidobacteriota bacterium]
MTFKRSLAMVITAACLGAVPLAQTKPSAGPALSVFKTPTCGCCSKWVDHMKKAGFQVTVTDMPQASLDNVKAKHQVPAAVHSCHTAVVDGYAIEGHVPATEVKRLLKEKQKVTGIAVPGMPLGSPGMESPGITPHPYDVLSFDAQGKTKVFATIKP